MKTKTVLGPDLLDDEEMHSVTGGNRQPLPWNRPLTNWTGAWGMQKVRLGYSGGDNVPGSIAQGDSIWDNTPNLP